MVASRSYRHFSKTFGVSLLVGALVGSCGGGEKKPDLGPKRQPRDNAAVANPPPPPKVDPLIPGFTIPAPHFRTPVGQEQGYFIQNAPKQHDLVMAPKGTRTMDGGVTVLPSRLPSASGVRRPSRQYVALPPMAEELSTASEEAAALPQLPIQPGFQSRPIDPDHPALQPKKKEKKSFLSKLRGIFRKEKPEPKRMPGEQGHILQGNVVPATPDRPQGFSELSNTVAEPSMDESVEVLREGDIDAVVEELSKQEEKVPEGKKMQIEPQIDAVEVPQEKEVTPAAWLTKEENVPVQDEVVQEIEEEKREFEILLDEMQPEEDINPAVLPMEAIYQEKKENIDEGKNIIELIEERRRQRYQPESLDDKSNALQGSSQPTSHKVIEKPVQNKPSVNWESDPDAVRLDDNTLPWLDEMSGQDRDFKGSSIPLKDADLEEAEILVEFDIDENGSLVDASGGKTAAGATMFQQQQVVPDADLGNIK